MKIGVIADTHLKGCDGKLGQILAHHFRDVDLILHAGDLVDPSVLEIFGGKDVRAVYGNADPVWVRQILSDRMVLQLGRFRLGLIHDCGMLSLNERNLPAGIESVDCLVFGHTHRPLNCVKGGVLWFNPGSATANRFCPFNSVGILEIGETITGEIVELLDN